MELIKAVLLREVDYWAREGALEVKKDTTTASMMERQFQQIKETYKRNDMVTLDMDLIDQEPVRMAAHLFRSTHDQPGGWDVQDQGDIQ